MTFLTINDFFNYKLITLNYTPWNVINLVFQMRRLYFKGIGRRPL